MASQHPHAHPSPNPDELMDLEILQLQEELNRMRKQRALIQLRSEIAREQQLLAEAQQSLGLAELPSVPVERPVERPVVRPRFNPPPDPRLSKAPLTSPIDEEVDSLIRGIKRSHSESSHENDGTGLENVGEYREAGQDNTGEAGQPPQPQPQQQELSMREKTQDRESRNGTENAQDEDVEVPPTFTVKRQYRGMNRKEYNLVIELLESHFAQYERYFAPNERKIEEGLRHVTPDIARAWGHHVVTDANTEPTWPNFCKFLLSRITHATDPAVARRYYYGRSQRENQTVREFSNHLGSWEQHLEELLTDEQRIQNLWEHVLPAVREEAKPFQYQSHKYQDHVAHLQTVESRMPSRAHVHRKIAAASFARYHNYMKQKQQNALKNAPKHPKAKRPRMNNYPNDHANNSTDCPQF